MDKFIDYNHNKLKIKTPMGTPENITTRKYIKTKQKNKLTTNVIKSQQTANNEKYVKQKLFTQITFTNGFEIEFQNLLHCMTNRFSLKIYRL